jgi:hypothetical protein
LRPRGS